MGQSQDRKESHFGEKEDRASRREHGEKIVNSMLKESGFLGGMGLQATRVSLGEEEESMNW